MNRIAITLLAGVAALGFASSTYAADLIIDYAPSSPGVVDVSGNWDGAYVGVFGGYAWGDADHNSGSPPNFINGYDIELSGWLVGATIGANVTVGSGLVVGVVGDAAWSNVEGSLVTGNPGVGTITHTIDWMATLRGKLGFDGGAFMPYLTAGLAVASATRDVSLAGTDSQTHFGWAAGAGVEFAATEDVSINLEYLYSDLGEAVYATGGTSPTVDLTTHQVRVGINWHF